MSKITVCILFSTIFILYFFNFFKQSSASLRGQQLLNRVEMIHHLRVRNENTSSGDLTVKDSRIFPGKLFDSNIFLTVMSYLIFFHSHFLFLIYFCLLFVSFFISLYSCSFSITISCPLLTKYSYLYFIFRIILKKTNAISNFSFQHSFIIL